MPPETIRPTPPSQERLVAAAGRVAAVVPNEPESGGDAAAVAPLLLGPPPTSLGARPTVEIALRRLAARDADSAGRLLFGLLASQGAAFGRPTSYDLVLGQGLGCIRVTAGASQVAVELHRTPRELSAIEFRVSGSPSQIARLVLASRLRRMLRFGLARVKGHRDGLEAMRALLALPLDLPALHQTGLWGGGDTILRLVAAMIDPAWTQGHSFTIAYAEFSGAQPIYLTISDGRPPGVSRTAPEGPVATTVTGSPAALVGLLRGDGSDADALSAQVSGDREPLSRVRGWAGRAAA